MTKTMVIALNALSTRSMLLARALDGMLHVFYSKPPYLSLYKDFLTKLNEFEPYRLIVQLPTGPLLGYSILFKKINRKKYSLIADVHTGFLVSKLSLSKHSILNYPFKGLLKYTNTILLHNQTNLTLISEKLRNKAVVLHDPFYVAREIYESHKDKINTNIVENEYVVFPASWHGDEPIDWILSIWEKYEIDLPLVITGKPLKKVVIKYNKLIEAGKIVLTGYLPYIEYLDLIRRAKIVLAATYSQLDSQCSAFEAMAFNRPILAPATVALWSIFRDNIAYYKVHNDQTFLDSLNEIINNWRDYYYRISSYSRRLEKDIRDKLKALGN